MHDSDERAARLLVVHDLVGTRPRFGRDARIGCTRAKLYVRRMHNRVHVSRVCTTRRFVTHGSVMRAVRDARLGYSLCTTRMSARLGWSWCTTWSGRVHHEARLGYSFCTTRMGARLGWSWCTTWSGRVHGSAATHGLVAHGLNFMVMIEPCGWFIGMLTCN